MLRVGLYSGKVYSEDDFRKDKIHECCVTVPKQEDLDAQKEYAKIQHRIACQFCHECEASRGI